LCREDIFDSYRCYGDLNYLRLICAVALAIRLFYLILTGMVARAVVSSVFEIWLLWLFELSDFDSCGRNGHLNCLILIVSML
jgi:hypothetical protein